MQRQSLGSPLSKLNICVPCQQECKEEQGFKKLMRRLNTKTYIHLIPMLTLLCFLILYLVSHDPSQNDLAHFNGLKTFSIDPQELQRLVEIKKGDILAIRSLKNFKQEAAATAKHQRRHRKIAHF